MVTDDELIAAMDKRLEHEPQDVRDAWVGLRLYLRRQKRGEKPSRPLGIAAIATAMRESAERSASAVDELAARLSVPDDGASR